MLEDAAVNAVHEAGYEVSGYKLCRHIVREDVRQGRFFEMIRENSAIGDRFG